MTILVKGTPPKMSTIQIIGECQRNHGILTKIVNTIKNSSKKNPLSELRRTYFSCQDGPIFRIRKDHFFEQWRDHFFAPKVPASWEYHFFVGRTHFSNDGPIFRKYKFPFTCAFFVFTNESLQEITRVFVVLFWLQVNPGRVHGFFNQHF